LLKPIRLRDFVMADNCFFSVVGYRNESSVKAFLRYIPSMNGDRSRNGKTYRKLMHEEAIEYALNSGMKYYDMNSGIFLIPHSEIQEVFKPEERIAQIGDKEVKRIVDFFGMPLNKMGVTGSRLIGLESDESDVDFVMYGNYWFRGQEKIQRGIERGKLSEPSQEMWEFIYSKRKVNIPFDLFLAHEMRKYHRAVIGNTYFDLLYVRDYDELNRQIPEEKGVKKEKITIRAELVDDRYVFDYPAFYPVKHHSIEAVLSYTHTYVGQAKRGETLEARGVVEEIKGGYYLIVGTSREVEDEYILSLNLIEHESLQESYRNWRESI